MSVEEVNNVQEFISKFPRCWELIEEAEEMSEGLIDLSQWEFDSVIEECGAIEVRFVEPDLDEMFIVTIDTSDYSWEARYER